MSDTTSRDNVTGIVLAGGRSMRFGADKLTVEIHGVTLLDRTVAALAGMAAEVIVVGPPRDLRQIPGLVIRTSDDPERFGGPLQALASALATTSTDLAMVVAGDMPTLETRVLALLADRLGSSWAADAVVLSDPHDEARRQPVPVALRVAQARAAATAALAAGERSLMRLLDRLAVSVVAADVWLPLDPEGRTLADIDLPDDLERLRSGARDQRKR